MATRPGSPTVSHGKRTCRRSGDPPIGLPGPVLTWIFACQVTPRFVEYDRYVALPSVHACQRFPAVSIWIGAKKFPCAPSEPRATQVLPPSVDTRVVPPAVGTKMSPLFGSTAKRPMQSPPMSPVGLFVGSGGWYVTPLSVETRR